MSSVKHRRRLEATNAGHYFADCDCGWAGGVHRDRATAADAWTAHRDGATPVRPVQTVVTFGERPRGMTADPGEVTK